jgi:ammonium transporter, Amt family
MDLLTRRKPSLLGGVNGMITGLVAITPCAGYVNGWGAMAVAAIASVVVYLAMNYISALSFFRRVDDTLGVIYTHGFAGLAGGILLGLFADPSMVLEYTVTNKKYTAVPNGAGGLLYGGGGHLLLWQCIAGAWIIVWSAIVTFIILKVVGLFIPLRMSTENMEIGDIAEHGHEVYPSDIPSLGAFQEAAAPVTA